MRVCREKASPSSFRNQKSPGWSSGSVPVRHPSKWCFESESFSAHPRENRISKSLTNSNCSDAQLRCGGTGFGNKESVVFGVLRQVGGANRFTAKLR